MNVSEISDFREYVEEQQQLCYGVELGGTPAVVGSLARQYDFLLETIDTYQEINQPQLDENQQIVIDLEMSDCSVEVTGWNYPDELDTENLSYLFSNVLENARALEQEEE